MRTNHPNQAELEALSKALTDKGLLMMAGFVSYQMSVIPIDAPAIQIAECRMAFMAGATHLFASIMTVLEPGAEPSLKDMQRMDKISDELHKFADDLKLAATRPQGRG